ncbi:hypothetical protein A5670_01100 [Mycolicibacterium fortuitum]|nr:hypothetical protein A5670_01100 [Mycolicibacterium fortuitum]
MITGELKSKVDRVWEAFWSGGSSSNPREVIEETAYLLPARCLDHLETLALMKARITVKADGLQFGSDEQELRWSGFKNAEPAGFNIRQIRSINLIATELTATGVVEAVRPYESPYTGHAPTGPDDVFGETDVDNIGTILNTARDNALPECDVA